MAKSKKVALSQIAINWNTQKDFVDTSIVGSRNLNESNENCSGMEWFLSYDEMEVLDKAVIALEN
ncbi:MAG: hypothetical protein FJZ98_04200 [Chloroflexi bacterium]|nr:hypothetical protein [Chloroflexota bacterium]